MHTSPHNRRGSSSSSTSPTTSDVIQFLSRNRHHVTSIRSFPRRRSTLLIIRCCVPQTPAPVLTISPSSCSDLKTYQMSPNIVRTQLRHYGGQCHHTRTIDDSASLRSSSERRKHGKTRTPQPFHVQSLWKYRLKLVTIFLRYCRSLKRRKRRRRTSEQRVPSAMEPKNDGDGAVGELLGARSPASRDSDFCESEDAEEDPDSPFLWRSSSEDGHIFVSHSDEDVELANLFMDKIESEGHRCYSLERDFMTGPMVSFTASALESSRRIILLLSKNYLQTNWCTFQLQMSVWIMYNRQRVLIIPVIVDLAETEVPSCLATMSLVDMRNDPNYQEKLMSILKGPEVLVKDMMPFGNMSHGLAWAYYLRYVKIILPGLKERIDAWCAKEQCVDEFIPRKLYILVPASCYCPEKLESVDGRLEFGGRLDPVRRNSAGSVDRSYDLSVWNLKQKDGQVMQFVGEYPAIIDTLYLMDCQRSTGLSSQLRRKERDHFVCILQRVLERDGLNPRVQLVVFHDTDADGHVKPLSDILEPYVMRDRLRSPPRPPPGQKKESHSVILHPAVQDMSRPWQTA